MMNDQVQQPDEKPADGRSDSNGELGCTFSDGTPYSEEELAFRFSMLGSLKQRCDIGSGCPYQCKKRCINPDHACANCDNGSGTSDFCKIGTLLFSKSCIAT